MIDIIREDFENGEARNEFLYAFCIDKTTVFEVEYKTLGGNKAPYFSTSAEKFNRPKTDWSMCGQAQERLLPRGSVARRFYDKWDRLHLKDLTDEEYAELISLNAFDSAASEKIFEDKNKGMLA